MIERECADWDGFYGIRWGDSDGFTVILAQVDRATGAAQVGLGLPLLGEELTEDEAIAIADEYASTVALLLADMRATLARMRGGQ